MRLAHCKIVIAINREGSQMKEYIVFSVVAIVGLLCIVWSQSLDSTNELVPFLDAVSSTLLMGGVLGVLYKKFVDGLHYKEIKRLLKVHDAIDDSGLLEFHPKVNEFNYTKIINEAKELTIVVNDGLSWIKHHANDLRNRFNQDTKTILFKLDPNSEFIPAFANKVNYTSNDYKSKLDTARVELLKLYDESTKKGTLEIHLLKNFPTHSLYLTEKQLIITPYQMSSKRLNIPVFVYDAEDKSKRVVKDIYEDLEHCFEEGKKIYPSKL